MFILEKNFVNPILQMSKWIDLDGKIDLFSLVKRRNTTFLVLMKFVIF